MTGGVLGRGIAAPARRAAGRATGRRLALPAVEAAVPTVTGWLLAVVAADLLVTRLFLRLAIFVPKDDVVAAVVGLLARVAAVVDTLVPLVGVALLGILLAGVGDSGRAGTRSAAATGRPPLAWRLGLVATSGVAAGGFALTFLPPTPTGVAALEGMVALAALLLVAPAIGVGRGPALGIGLAALGGATALAAGARLVGAVAGSVDATAVAGLALPIFLAGELAFVLGAVAIGVAGLRSGQAGSRTLRAAVGAGVAVAAALVAASLAVPAPASILLIWSVGLVSGLVPFPVVALAAGLAVAGVGTLASDRRILAAGVGAVLLAGYGLAASGLTLAGLLGLAVAGRGTWTPRDGTPGDRPAA